MATCQVCFRHCELKEGQTGFCGARICAGGVVRAANYGRVTSLAIDPIEKKPLNRFMPGSRILSVGSYGCNLRCPFCQNHEISWSAEAMRFADTAELITPEKLAKIADYYRKRGSAGITGYLNRLNGGDTNEAGYRYGGNIGVAFTYNEPLVGYEFVRDTAKLVHEAGMVNVLVSNGTAELAVLEEILPYIDAMNIDLKGFTDRYYNEVLGGDRGMVMRFIERAVQSCHVELTTLIIPGENDSEEEMRQMCAWIAGLSGNVPGNEIPLHISRFFPRFHMTDRPATSVKNVYRLAEVARGQLKYVYTGNC